MREPRQEMRIPKQDQSGERTRWYHRDRDSVYMAPASKKDEGLITVSFNQDHQSQRKHIARSIETVS